MISNKKIYFSAPLTFLLCVSLFYFLFPTEFLSRYFYLFLAITFVYILVFSFLFFKQKSLATFVISIIIISSLFLLTFWGAVILTTGSLITGFVILLLFSLFKKDFLYSNNVVPFTLLLILFVINGFGIYDRWSYSSRGFLVQAYANERSQYIINNNINVEKPLDLIGEGLSTLSKSLSSKCGFYFHPGIKNKCLNNAYNQISRNVNWFDGINNIRESPYNCSLSGYYRYYQGNYPYPGHVRVYSSLTNTSEDKVYTCLYQKWMWYPIP